MCTGELKGPAGELSRSLASSPLVQNTNPWDILNTLRPLETKVRAGSIHAATGAVMRLQRRVQQVKLIVTKSREVRHLRSTEPIHEESTLLPQPIPGKEP